MAKFGRYLKSFVKETAELDLRKNEQLPMDTHLYQLDDGTIIYHQTDSSIRLYVKYEGESKDVILPNDEMNLKMRIAVHGNLIYIYNNKKFYKVEFNSAKNASVSYLRSLRDGERIHRLQCSQGILCSRKESGKRYFYRIYEDYVRDGILVDVEDEKLADLELQGIHRGKFIYVAEGRRRSARKLSKNILLFALDYGIQFSKTSLPRGSFFCDSSPFFYAYHFFASFTAINIEKMEVLPTVGCIYDVAIIGVHNGFINVKASILERTTGTTELLNNIYFMTAKLPRGYYKASVSTTEVEETLENDFEQIELTQLEGMFRSEFEAKFTVVNILGQGGYGCVFEAENKLDNWTYAVKRIPLRGREKDLAEALKEIRTLASFDCPGIVRYNHSWKEEPPVGWQRSSDEMLAKRLNYKEAFNYKDDCAFLYIQMELCKGTLADWINTERNRDLNIIKLWFKQIVSAVSYIHDRKLIHRDLKPSNILFAKDDKLKICDLGIVADRAIKNGQEVPLTRTAQKGTIMYMAPEQRGWKYSSKVDIFSLGLILAEMCAVMTFEEAQEAFELYQKGRRPDILKDLPQVEELVASLTHKKDVARPDCAQILNHPFLV